jgi:hypothetical protein
MNGDLESYNLVAGKARAHTVPDSSCDISNPICDAGEQTPSRFKRHFSFTESRSQMPNKKRHGSLGTWPTPSTQD